MTTPHEIIIELENDNLSLDSKSDACSIMHAALHCQTSYRCHKFGACFMKHFNNMWTHTWWRSPYEGSHVNEVH